MGRCIWTLPVTDGTYGLMLGAFIRDNLPLSQQEALMISPLRLAYIGDAVHDLFVRTSLIFQGGKAGAMHRDAVQNVNARAQARALLRIANMLTETESDVVRRGRNAHAHHSVPKRTSPADYKHATGLEALLGFLYLTGQQDRLFMLYSAMHEPQEDTTCPSAP